jgi:hypothetical protein
LRRLLGSVCRVRRAASLRVRRREWAAGPSPAAADVRRSFLSRPAATRQAGHHGARAVLEERRILSGGGRAARGRRGWETTRPRIGTGLEAGGTRGEPTVMESRARVPPPSEQARGEPRGGPEVSPGGRKRRIGEPTAGSGVAGRAGRCRSALDADSPDAHSRAVAKPLEGGRERPRRCDRPGPSGTANHREAREKARARATRTRRRSPVPARVTRLRFSAPFRRLPPADSPPWTLRFELRRPAAS